MIYAANYFTFEWNSICRGTFLSLVFGVFHFSEFHPHSVQEIQTFLKEFNVGGHPSRKKERNWKALSRCLHERSPPVSQFSENTKEVEKKQEESEEKRAGWEGLTERAFLPGCYRSIKQTSDFLSSSQFRPLSWNFAHVRWRKSFST